MISVILPTFNERQNICPLIYSLCKELTDFNFEIIVVDDNSLDGTFKEAEKHFSGNDKVRLFLRTSEKGLAKSIRFGIEMSKGDFIAVMDTDFNHEPHMIPQMIYHIEHYDMVIGSRFASGGRMQDQKRYICSFLFNILIRIAIRSQVQDNLSGFFVIRRDALNELKFNIVFEGYGDYFFKLIYFVLQRKRLVLEIPVFYKNRSMGKSKTNFLKVLLQYTSSLLLFYFKNNCGRFAKKT